MIDSYEFAFLIIFRTKTLEKPTCMTTSLNKLIEHAERNARITINDITTYADQLIRTIQQRTKDLVEEVENRSKSKIAKLEKTKKNHMEALNDHIHTGVSILILSCAVIEMFETYIDQTLSSMVGRRRGLVYAPYLIQESCTQDTKNWWYYNFYC